MATKTNEISVDEILGSREPTNKLKDTKTAKKGEDDWGGEEEENYAFGIGKEQAGAKKVTKKKTAAKGWNELEQAQAAQTKNQDFAKIQEDEQKKKIIKKPGQARANTGVEVGSEYFPSLGEAPVKQPPKKTEPTPVVAPAQTNDGFSVVGVKKFTNTKKKETGEHFAPLDPNTVQKEVPVAPVREKVESTVTTQTAQTTHATQPRGIFQRKTEEPPAEVPTDTKFKFGAGEGPKKFAGAKISFRREEEKDDHEALRLQREREIEEKLQKEKEELAKQRENREKKFANKEHGTGEGHDEKKPMRFTNAKKETDKQHEKPQPAVVEVPENNEPKQPKETVEMHGSLSNKAWGDGPLIKKTQKK